MERDKPGRIVLGAIARLPGWQRAAIYVLIGLIVVTWLATCVVLATFLV